MQPERQQPARQCPLFTRHERRPPARHRWRRRARHANLL